MSKEQNETGKVTDDELQKAMDIIAKKMSESLVGTVDKHKVSAFKYAPELGDLFCEKGVDDIAMLLAMGQVFAWRCNFMNVDRQVMLDLIAAEYDGGKKTGKAA